MSNPPNQCFPTTIPVSVLKSGSGSSVWVWAQVQIAQEYKLSKAMRLNSRVETLPGTLQQGCLFIHSF